MILNMQGIINSIYSNERHTGIRIIYVKLMKFEALKLTLGINCNILKRKLDTTFPYERAI